MRIVVFGQDRRVGAWVDESIIDVNLVDPQVPANLRAFIDAGERALDKTRRVVAKPDSIPKTALLGASDVRLMPPWPGLRVACMGANYVGHVVASSGQDKTLDATYRRIRESGPWGFWKVGIEPTGPDDEVAKPPSTKYLDYEGEAAVVIGKRIKNWKGARADEVIFGVTLMNDWSNRDVQHPDFLQVNALSRAQLAQRYGNPFFLGKNFDGAFAIGPSILVDEISCDAVPVTTRVNGQVRQDYTTNEMVFSFAECLEALSADVTLYPGDILAGGTSSGTASDQSRRVGDEPIPTGLFLRAGDIVEISSPQIGTLRQRVV